MIIIHTAIHPEAKQLISLLKLKRDLEFPVFELYRNDEFTLIISGIGKVNTAIALATTIQYLKGLGYLISTSTLVNFGLAGGTEELEIGELYYIQKITDHATDSNYYPDLIYINDLTPAVLTTFDRPVLRAKHPELTNTLVDMEASAFFQTANKFLAIHQIHVIKILIDHLTPQDFKLELLTELIEQKIDLLKTFLNSLPKAPILKELSPNELAEEQSIEKVVFDLQLSKSQAQQLYDLIAQYHTMTNLLFTDFIRTYHYKLSEHKSVNANSFEKLKAKLSIEIGKHLGS